MMTVGTQFCFAVLFISPASALTVRSVGKNFTFANRGEQLPTFQSFYHGYKRGPGIWKWSNALDAYQHHFAGMAGRSPLAVAEVGVQSGGSIDMWKAVLGKGVHYYGLDINKACRKFQNSSTTIFIGDQADDRVWDAFYSKISMVDILVDDGGHEAHQMSVTFRRSFDHLNSGGFVATEDVFRKDQWQFLYDATKSIGVWKDQVESVHMYPGVFLLQKKPAHNDFVASLPPSSAVVDSWETLWAAVQLHPGTTVTVKNKGWGAMFTEATMHSIVQQFVHLYTAGGQTDDPPGCAFTPAPVCTATVVNSAEMNLVTGVHIYQDVLYVEAAAKPPVISAVRKGDKWIPYGL